MSESWRRDPGEREVVELAVRRAQAAAALPFADAAVVMVVRESTDDAEYWGWAREDLAPVAFTYFAVRAVRECADALEVTVDEALQIVAAAVDEGIGDIS